MEERKILHVGFEVENFEDSALPRVKDVLCVFFFHHRSEHKTVRDSARATIKKVENMWKALKIPVVQEIRSIERIEKIFMEWKKLSKNRFRTSSQFSTFSSKLELLFDITTKDAVHQVQAEIAAGPSAVRKRILEKSLDYYQEQSRPRALRNKIFKPALVEDEEDSLHSQIQQNVEVEQNAEPAENLDEREENIPLAQSESDVEYNENIYKGSEKQRGRRDIISKELALALDAAKVSHYQAAVILAAAAKAMGVDVASTNINESSIRRKRAAWRTSTVAEIRENFQPDDVMTVHWDGKIVDTLTGTENVERVAIMVTGVQSSQLLGAPAMQSSTGKAIAETVVQHLDDWNITNNVKAMSFDTTAVNSGWKNGAATWIERSLDRNLLWLPCRHHINELILESIYTTIMGKSSGPEVQIFKSFQRNWKKIDTIEYQVPQRYPKILDPRRRQQLITFAQAKIDVRKWKTYSLQNDIETFFIFIDSATPGRLSRAIGAHYHLFRRDSYKRHSFSSSWSDA